MQLGETQAWEFLGVFEESMPSEALSEALEAICAGSWERREGKWYCCHGLPTRDFVKLRLDNPDSIGTNLVMFHKKLHDGTVALMEKHGLSSTETD